MISQRVVLNPLKPKADGTANITGCTLLEVDKSTFEWVNDLAFDKEEVKMILVLLDDYETFILAEAKRLADELN